MHSIGLTSVNLPAWRDARLWLRANAEWLGTLATGAIAAIWRHDIAAQFAADAWDLGAFYSAIFDWSSIQAAFLFGVYAFFLSRSEPFIQAIAGSEGFRLLRRYVVRTLYLSMTLSVAALPMVVAPIAFSGGNEIGFVVLWSLAMLLVYTFLCFLKVIRVFGKIERRS